MHMLSVAWQPTFRNPMSHSADGKRGHEVAKTDWLATSNPIIARPWGNSVQLASPAAFLGLFSLTAFGVSVHLCECVLMFHKCCPCAGDG